jgi:glycosyl hydrolase family 38
MRPICLGLVFAVCMLVRGMCVGSEPEYSSAAQNWPQLEEIVLVFKTHFDIGYTDMAANVVQRYRTSMIDSALDVVDASRDLPEDQQFVWTIPGWPMAKILEDWEGQTPERKQRLMDAFREGRFVVHGLPFTTHTETLSEEDLIRGMAFSSELSRAAGLELPTDAKMTDVPCHSWIVPTLLAHVGIRFMHEGTNSGSSDPKVPLLHFREGPDGSRVLTMHVNGYGTGVMPPDDWPYKTWLGLIHTGDNHGPPRPEEVRKVIDEIGEKLPGVKVRIGRLSDFADAILEKEDLDKIPVVRGDTPDTWIHGPMCDPQGRIAARRAQVDLPTIESLNTMLDAWGIGAAGENHTRRPWETIAQGYEQSLLYGEHTWGASFGWIGYALPYGADWQDQLDERHARMVASWDEHSTYAEQADAISGSLLEEQLIRLSQSIDSDRYRAAVYNPLPWKRDGLAVIDGETHVVQDIPPMGYRTLNFGELERRGGEGIFLLDEERTGQYVVESDFFRLTYDLTGCVTSLVDKRANRELIRKGSEGFGDFLYERFSADQCDQFMRDYNVTFPRWVTTQFTKPGLPRDVPYQAVKPRGATVISEPYWAGDYRGVRIVYRDNPALPCKGLEYEIRLYDEFPMIDISLSIEGKRPETWPEAGWMCLPLNIDRPKFRLSRLGGIVDPAKDIIPGSNRHLLWLHHGMAVYGEDGYGVGICPIDAPLVSLGEPGCWKFSRDYVPDTADVFVNLFNNQWNTNFRLWNEGSWKQTVRLWTFEKYDPETSLIRPALEARFPMVGVSPPESRKRGKLPPKAAGLELSRRDVLVTSFGIDPHTEKLMLRLWEQAGKDGPCTITLPEGLNVSAAQPCDLRGRVNGDRIAVDDGVLQVDIRHNAPLNLELIRGTTTDE